MSIIYIIENKMNKNVDKLTYMIFSHLSTKFDRCYDICDNIYDNIRDCVKHLGYPYEYSMYYHDFKDDNGEYLSIENNTLHCYIDI